MQYSEILWADIGLAAVGVALVISAWRRLDHGPTLLRLMLGGVSTLIVGAAFSALILAVGRLPAPAQARACEVSRNCAPEQREPAALPAQIVAPAPAPDPAPAPAQPPITGMPGSAAPGLAALERPATAAIEAPKEQAVPVRDTATSDTAIFYGTDRAVEPHAASRYGQRRAGKLELGRAILQGPSLFERIAAVGGLSASSTGASAGPPLRDVEPLTSEEFQFRLNAAALPGETARALLYIHGFNTSFETAVGRAAAIAQAAGSKGPVLAYSWPASGAATSYTWDRDSVTQASPFLTAFLKLVRDSGAGPLDIVAEGMGSEALRAALQAADGPTIGTVILAAPDLDRASFMTLTDELTGKRGDTATRVTLYASSSDRALTIAKAFHDGEPRAGDVPADGPLVLPGVVTIDVTSAPTSTATAGPGDSMLLLADIGRVLASGSAPADPRERGFGEVHSHTGAVYLRALR